MLQAPSSKRPHKTDSSTDRLFATNLFSVIIPYHFSDRFVLLKGTTWGGIFYQNYLENSFTEISWVFYIEEIKHNLKKKNPSYRIGQSQICNKLSSDFILQNIKAEKFTFSDLYRYNIKIRHWKLLEGLYFLILSSRQLTWGA